MQQRLEELCQLLGEDRSSAAPASDQEDSAENGSGALADNDDDDDEWAGAIVFPGFSLTVMKFCVVQMSFLLFLKIQSTNKYDSNWDQRYRWTERANDSKRFMRHCLLSTRLFLVFYLNQIEPDHVEEADDDDSHE